MALGAALIPVSALADNTIVFAGVGSSAMFNVFKTASLSQAGVSVNTNSYQARNSGRAVDGAVSDTGEMYVVWDNGEAGSRRIWLYLSTDSTVGVRCFFNKARLRVVDSDTSTAGIQPPAAATGTAMPVDVIGSIDDILFSAGMTDITPADAKVATTRLLQLGYGTTRPVRGLSSTIGSIASATPVDFNIANRSFQLNALGASPILVFVNNTDTAAGGFGTPAAENINRFVLAGYLDGTFTRTRDTILVSEAVPVDKKVVTFIREGLSGTYVTMEFCIPQSVFTSQELGVSSAIHNPLNQTVPAYNANNPMATLTKGGRVRAIGTSALVQAVNRTPNSLGYSFWSTGNFSAANASNTKYLMVDGVDPLIDTYNGGFYPSGSAVTFRHVKNGAYPIWSILRAVTDPNPSSDVINLFSLATGTAGGGNFVAKNDLLVFRSHRATKDTPVPNNGNNGQPEAGADAGGAVFPIIADKDFFADTGMDLVNLRLGETPRRFR